MFSRLPSRWPLIFINYYNCKKRQNITIVFEAKNEHIRTFVYCWLCSIMKLQTVGLRYAKKDTNLFYDSKLLKISLFI